MLALAKPYEDQLKLLFADIAFKDDYKYCSHRSFRDTYAASDSTWNKHEFVSLNGNGKVVGYFAYAIDREVMSAHQLEVINFNMDKLTTGFSKDFQRFIDDIFTKFNFNSMVLSAIVGSPAEMMYDKRIPEIGGRIVGAFKEDSRLIDGKIYDRKVYEVLKKDYFIASFR